MVAKGGVRSYSPRVNPAAVVDFQAVVGKERSVHQFEAFLVLAFGERHLHKLALVVGVDETSIAGGLRVEVVDGAVGRV